MNTKRKPSKRENDIKKSEGVDTPKGLHNLGNTCYFNSALQCLGRVNLLTDFLFDLSKRCFSASITRLTENNNIETLPLYIPLFESPMSEAYVSLMIDLFGTANSRNSLSPSILRTHLTYKFPRFEGFGQHDSHEVLRCLLDGLRQEEIKRWQRAILTKLKVDPELKKVSELDKKDVKSWGRATGLCATVDRIFAGIMLSSLTCKECETVYQNFEVFLDISLPIVDLEPSNRHQNNNNNPSTPPIANCKQKHKTKRELKKERKARQTRGPGKHKKRNSKKLNYPKEENSEEVEEEEKQNEKVEENGVTEEKKEVKNEGGNENFEDEKSDDSEENVAPKEEIVENGIDRVGSEEEKVKNIHQNDDRTSISPSGNPEPSEIPTCNSTGDEYLSIGNPEPSEIPTCNSTGDEYLSPGETELSEIPTCNSTNDDGGNAGDLEDNTEGGISDSSESPDAQVDTLTYGLANIRVSSAGQAVRVDDTNAQEISLKTMAPARSNWTDLEHYLERFTAAEVLSGTNRTICATCTKRKFGANSKEDVRCETIKQDLVIRPPAILTIHLKRFQQVGSRLQKCSKDISFPINLDMSPFCSRLSRPLPHGCKVMYRLFGIVEHSGHLRGGHYVSYVAVEPASSNPSERRHLPDPQFISPLEKPEPWPMTLHHLVYQMRRANQEIINGNYDETDDFHATAISQVDDRRWYHCSDGHVSPVTLNTLLKAQPYLLFYERVA